MRAEERLLAGLWVKRTLQSVDLNLSISRLAGLSLRRSTAMAQDHLELAF